MRVTACAGSTGATFGFDLLARETAAVVDVDPFTHARNVENTASGSDYSVTDVRGPMRVPAQRGNLCPPENA